ncbi:hypothetical protein NQ318_003724 [Aromia moschata]|uniref:Uncharacterized protein n=1 Tax=Aromia moschata TaxID=1265417 RepID=A0AAV8XGV0_9CUCU|nr:hypothetical protein NQ318_003724 [Aromia moschata]
MLFRAGMAYYCAYAGSEAFSGRINAVQHLHKPNYGDEVDDKIATLMNGAVKEALGITQVWGSNNNVFDTLAGDFMKPVTNIVEELLNTTDIKVAVYNGQLDLIVDTPGTNGCCVLFLVDMSSNCEAN